jgi:hypothetical protein
MATVGHSVGQLECRLDRVHRGDVVRGYCRCRTAGPQQPEGDVEEQGCGRAAVPQQAVEGAEEQGTEQAACWTAR